ncbi:MAG: peptidylprolyl isomerase, partial [Burkholderiales bacterium]|nr:peptidylprolyl isomerase [Burkholderiales bacterium]
MFDLVQKYKRLIQVFLGLIAITFATWGIESYTTFRSARDSVATVNGMDISQRQLGERLREYQERVRAQLGGQVDPSAIDTPEVRRALLEGLITERLVASEVARAHMFMSREAAIEAITQAPEFQEDGKFSTAKYSQYLASRGISDAGNVAELQGRIPLQRFAGAIAGTAIAPRSVAARLVALEGQKREVSEVRIPVQQFLPQVKIDEAQLKAHYEANQSEYRTPERVRAEYVVLSPDALAKQEEVKAEEVRAFWESSFGAKVKQREDALAKARAVLATVRKNPEAFAEVAKRESQDPGSAAQGGDLGFTPRGTLVKPVEDAIWRLKENEISGIVESSYGFHVIRVTGIRKEERRASHILIEAPTDAKPYEEMRADLEADLRKQRAAKRFAQSADDFQNLVYEQADSLKPAAERFKLQAQQTGWITKSASQELGALDNPKLLAALFSSDAIQNRRNTDAIEVAPNTLVAARVVEHQAARNRSFDEVKGEIAEAMRSREASALALKDGQAKLERLRKGEDAGLKWSAPRLVSRRDAQGLSGNILRQVVSADTSKLPAYIGVPIPDAGYVLL